MKWPAQNPDRNPVEHLWYALEKRIKDRRTHLRNTEQLVAFLQEKWQKITFVELQTQKGIPAFPRQVFDEYRWQRLGGNISAFPSHEALRPYIYRVLDSCLADFKANTKLVSTDNVKDVAFEQAEFLENLFMAALTLYQRKVSLDHSEAVFNTLLVYPFVSALTSCISEDKFGKFRCGFFPGEEDLLSMSKQMGAATMLRDDRHCYKPDSVVSLLELQNVEVLIVEVSGPYGSTGLTKLNFDRRKGMFWRSSHAKKHVRRHEIRLIGCVQESEGLFPPSRR
ncbi:hypothetical protein EC973_006094 [Apophysomyces ossiformis]|uniref:Uncharacterized protein n=1 Tax=Apophysomyces ossiformis TaxID=679940 RepID=A0A8H7BR02_9FUNG|nr:hypothetical protein EC973_006094 [Apophysomyces ossiformis]